MFVVLTQCDLAYDYQYREVFVTADKSTIKKCEDLLEKLPTEVAKPVSRKPMWSFLRSIDGFDTVRAAKCLGMLLDAEYGTVSGLKLATTQDLVEVVGLKHEDALRIVHAARNAGLEPGKRTSGCCTCFALRVKNVVQPT